MAIINFYTRKPDCDKFDLTVINHDGSAPDWLVKNIENGENFEVFEGEINKSNEISRDYSRLKATNEVSVFINPSASVLVIGAIIAVAAVFAAAVLAPKPKALGNLNRNQQSPNNSLSSRNNVARPNQRIVDICGSVKAIPDIIQQEYSRYVNNIEQRVGYYCVARGDLQIEKVSDGGTEIQRITQSSAGVYPPFKSPNNSAPSIQIGDVINEDVVGVTESLDANGQTLPPINEGALSLSTSVVGFPDARLVDNTGNSDFSSRFSVGDKVIFKNTEFDDGAGGTVDIGNNEHTVISVTSTTIQLSQSTPAWFSIPVGGGAVIDNGNSPSLSSTASLSIGPFRVTAAKINKLVVNVFARGGLYADDGVGRTDVSVNYIVYYRAIATPDEPTPEGPFPSVGGVLTGRDSDEKGSTVEVNFNEATYVEYWVQRTSSSDFQFQGTLVDEIKLKSVFGLSNVNKSDFGNVTTIQTRRKALHDASAIKSPELNCIATEMVNKYNGGGSFDASKTPNTQAMQSLIRVALDPYIGRREQSELDLDLLLKTQSDIESYFKSAKAGEFNYSFDSTSISAQEALFSIAQAAFTSLWREGRVLKALFEQPQTVPSMVFTHRSKQPNTETWSRKIRDNTAKDSIEFTYTDAESHTKEIMYFPVDRSGRNPDRVEMTGVKGVEQATWQMMRRYNKMLYQEISVDFGATSEGRFVKPKRIISVVKGSRVHTYDGEVMSVNGLNITLSQEVAFTPNDNHFVVLKKRDGSTESIKVSATESKMVVTMSNAPVEPIYTGTSALRTEFSFGNEARLSGQLMIPESIDPSDNQYVKISAVNYSDLYYKDDPAQ